MERDTRRSPGQWRGCYAFEDICDGGDNTAPRKGGLKMGSTYYYYVSVLEEHLRALLTNSYIV